MKSRARRGGSRIGLAAVACVLVGALWLTGTASAALQVAVSPTNIVWTSNTWVTVTVSNLAAGADVKLGLYLDVQGNGVVDEGRDPILAAYRVKDGGTNWLGASVIVDDDDAAVNGRTVSRVAYFGQQSILHGIGTYLWVAKTVSGGTTTVARFTVTQPTSTVWIAGTVVDYVTSNAVEGTAVTFARFTDGPTPLVWTGTNGAFKVYLPAGVSTADVQNVNAVGVGYFNPETGPGGTEPIATYVFTNDLRTGANPLPGPLRVVPKIPGMIYEVSGHVYDPRTNAVPGILVNIEWEGEDDDDEGWAVGLTDTNGVYRLCVPAVAGADLYADPESMTRLGLVATVRQVTVSGDTNGIDLLCPAATLLARGKVLAADDGAGVAGATIEVDGDGLGCQGVSVFDGSCEIPVIPYDNYNVDVDDVSAWGFMRVPGYDGLSITNNSVTNLDFRVLRTYPVSGTVYDTQTNRMTGGICGAFRYREVKFWEWEVNSTINRHGDFRLAAPTGSLVVVVAQVPGCVGVVYRNHDYGEWDSNHEAELVTNTTAGASGVNFYLVRTARIEGTVRGGGEPLQGMSIMVSERVGNDWQWRNVDDTDANGFYSIEVAPGTNYGVTVGSEPEVGLWLGQAYDHVPDLSEATLVTTAVDHPATNIDFDLEVGSLICGRVFEEDGVTPVADCPVNAVATDGNYDNDNYTDENGNFAIIVPPGSYTVEARPDWESLPYLRQYFSNAVYEADALPLNALAGVVISNTDFRLSQALRITGHVYRGDGGGALQDCHVFASDYDSNEWMAGNNTDENGEYTLWLPAGTYRVRAYPAQEGLRYESQLYDGTYRYDDAEPVTVSETEEAVGVDFTLQPAGTISGHIYVGPGMAAPEGCQVVAEDSLTGEWMGWDNTAPDGSYRLIVPAGTYRVLARPSNDGLPYADQYYEHAFSREEAEPVDVIGTGDTPGIDITLAGASYFTGRLTDKTTGSPIAGISVQAARIPDLSDFWNNWSYYGSSGTDSNGEYWIAVPPGSNYIVQTDSGDSYYPFRCWSNQVDRMQATLLTIAPDSTVAGIDFVLQAGGRITGQVRRDDDGAPVGYCNIYAANHATGEWMDGSRTDGAGRYALVVPTGMTYRVMALPADTGMPYVNEWYDDVLDWDEAYPVPVGLLSETPNIDISVMTGNLSHDDWRAHYFTPAELLDEGISGDDADPDGDRADNRSEHVADTNPRNSNSVLRLTGLEWTGGLRLEWKGGRWAQQSIQRSETPDAPDEEWTDIHYTYSLPTVVSNWCLDTDEAPARYFYRVKAER